MNCYKDSTPGELTNCVDHDGLMMLMFTSGTTGRSKAAICTWTAAGATPPRQQKKQRPVPAGWRLTAPRWKKTPNC